MLSSCSLHNYLKSSEKLEKFLGDTPGFIGYDALTNSQVYSIFGFLSIYYLYDKKIMR